MEAKLKAIKHRITDVETNVNKRIKKVENDVDNHETILKGNGKTGMRAAVEKNTDFRKELKIYVRAGVLMFMAEGVAVIIWVLSQANQ